MAEVRPYTSLQGILIPHYLLDDTVTATSQGGPIPAVPTATTSNTGTGVLEATGTHDTTTRRVYCSRAGNPGSGGAEVLWRASTDADTYLRGWNPPTVVTETEGLWDDIGGGHIHRGWDAVRTANGTLVAVLDDYDALPQDAYRPAWWTDSAGWTEGGAAIVTRFKYAGARHAVCADDSGGIYCIIQAAAGILTTDSQIEVWRSSETAPGTWTLYSRDALQTTTTASWDRMRAAWTPRGIVLVTCASDDVTQWVSTDNGATFRLVEAWAGTQDAIQPDLCTLPDGRIVLAYVNQTGADTVCIRVISDPSASFRTAEEVVVFTASATQLSVCATEDGERVVVVHDGTSSYLGQVMVWYLDARDLSATGVQDWLQGLAAGDDTVGYTGLCCRFAGGQMHGLALIEDNANHECDWLTTFRAGGWRTRAMPRFYLTADNTGRHSWGRAYPYASALAPSVDAQLLIAADDGAGNLTPVVRNWTLTNTAASVDATVAAWEWDFSGGAGQGRYHMDSTNGTVAGGVIVGWECRVPSGGDATASHVAVEVVVADGATETRCVVRFGPASIKIHDLIAAADVDTDNWDSTGWGSFLLAVAKEEVTLWGWRLGATKHTLFMTGALTTTAVAPAALSRVIWGQPANSTAASQWRWIGWVAGDDAATAAQDLIDQGSPLGTYARLDLPGRTVPAAEPCYLDSGLMLRGTRGALALADTWDLAPAYQYPATALLPRIEASPRRGWRSTDDGTEQIIGWTLTAGEPMGPTIGIVLLRPNFATALWEGYTGGAWATIATLSTYVASGLGYTRQGNAIIPAAAAPGSSRYIARNELVGGYVVLDAGADVRPITANTEGVWGVATTRKTVKITMDGDNTEPASGADLAIIGPVYGAVLHEQSTAYSRYRLRIAATTCYEGVHQLGGLVVGDVAMFGRQTARGRVVATAHGTTVSRSASRVSSARVDGPPQRVVTLQPGVSDMTGLAGTAPAPDYLTGSNTGLPVATWNDVAMLLEGVQRETDGPAIPVVYLPRIPRGSGLQALRGYEDIVYGRAESGVSRAAELGYENTSEVVNTDAITFVEEP